MAGLHQEIDRSFNEFAQGPNSNGGSANLLPTIDIAIRSRSTPGLERKDVKISIDDDTLSIGGEKRIEEDQKDKNVQHSKRCHGVFMRVLQLPCVDPLRARCDVERRPEDHDSETGQPGSEEDRGQGRSNENDPGGPRGTRMGTSSRERASCDLR
ncbi:Hsp20/alpha crystallin family protein [Bradyrhizobium rifense]|uniref:Hsp20/alpha crystallin family protein n=1 Tax=Bradyrhizobium rifense TaxID=515499 RepID=UPI001652DFF0|nr:Hsp20/alpha crystallin family protein [Bradyrhizobium rifense]